MKETVKLNLLYTLITVSILIFTSCMVYKVMTEIRCSNPYDLVFEYTIKPMLRNILGYIGDIILDCRMTRVWIFVYIAYSIKLINVCFI